MRKFKSHRRRKLSFRKRRTFRKTKSIKRKSYKKFTKKVQRVVNATAETKYFTYPLVTDTLINSGVSSGAFFGDLVLINNTLDLATYQVT